MLLIECQVRAATAGTPEEDRRLLIDAVSISRGHLDHDAVDATAATVIVAERMDDPDSYLDAVDGELAALDEDAAAAWIAEKAGSLGDPRHLDL